MSVNTLASSKRTLQDQLSAVELAALAVAGRKLDREQLEPGEYPVFARVTLSGAIKVGEPVATVGPADYQGVLAFVLSCLDPHERASLAAMVADDFQVTAEQREAAKALCEPTRRASVRSGAITGVVSISLDG
jgi:hypothetical protein